MGTPVPAEAYTICSLYAGWNRLRTTAQLPDAGGPAAAKNLLHPLWQRSMHPAPRQLASLALRQCGQTVCRRGGSRQSKERGSQPTEAQGERRRSAPLTLPLLHFPTRRLHAAQACLAEHRHPVAADGLPDEVRWRGCRRRRGVASRARRRVTDAARARLAYLIHCATRRGVSKGPKHPKASLDAPLLLTQRAAPQHSLHFTSLARAVCYNVKNRSCSKQRATGGLCAHSRLNSNHLVLNRGVAKIATGVAKACKCAWTRG